MNEKIQPFRIKPDGSILVKNSRSINPFIFREFFDMTEGLKIVFAISLQITELKAMAGHTAPLAAILFRTHR